MRKKLSIGYVGLSHLGLNYLAVSAKKNFSIIGVMRTVKELRI